MIPLAPSNCLTPRRLLATLSSLFVIIASSTDALAQGYATSTVDGAWSYLPVSPSRRAASSAIYDPVRDRMWIYSGRDPYWSALGEVWNLTLRASPTWQGIVPNGGVSAVWGAVPGYDGARDRFVLFSGANSAAPFDYDNGTRVLALAGSPTWVNLPSSGAVPLPRQGSAGFIDRARDRLVIFGGKTYDGSNEAYANDVRYQDLATGAWTLAAAAGTPPFDDLDVAPGDEYDYALAIEGGAGVLGAVHVTVPSRLGLRLEGARPNPAVGGGFAVAFALDRQAPGDLELLDLAGRRIDRVGLGSLPPGNHVLRLAAHQGLAPGVYLVRLRHAGRTLDRHAVMIH